VKGRTLLWLGDRRGRRDRPRIFRSLRAIEPGSPNACCRRATKDSRPPSLRWRVTAPPTGTYIPVFAGETGRV
jgi:hypothetical protein